MKTFKECPKKFKLPLPTKYHCKYCYCAIPRELYLKIGCCFTCYDKNKHQSDPTLGGNLATLKGEGKKMLETPLAYLRRNVLIEGEKGADFMRMWKELSDKDKTDLKNWAQEEIEAQ